MRTRIRISGPGPPRGPLTNHHLGLMTNVEGFQAEVGSILDSLSAGGLSHADLNLAAARVDRLGRQLHGIGFVREAEIANWLNDAVERLLASHFLAGESAANNLIEARSSMDLALTAMDEGVRPYGP